MDPDSGPIVTVFRSRLRSEALPHYGQLASDMESRARAGSGLLDFKSFVAEDGERVSIVMFDTWLHHCRWRDDEEHLAAQRRGRRQFYSEYTIRVCQEVQHREFHGA